MILLILHIIYYMNDYVNTKALDMIISKYGNFQSEFGTCL